MAPLHWDRVGWVDFVQKLEGYREHYARRGREDRAYLPCVRTLQERQMRERAARTRDIVLFLNTWACRLPREDSVRELGAWIPEHLDELERLEGVSIVDAAFPDRIGDMVDLYASVVALRIGRRGMGDTAASKFLHVLLPEAFVMWDNTIKPFARDYRDYLTEMHRLGARLTAESGVAGTEVEDRLQRHLGYGVRKTLAKYLDEYNWYVAVGEEATVAELGAP